MLPVFWMNAPTAYKLYRFLKRPVQNAWAFFCYTGDVTKLYSGIREKSMALNRNMKLDNNFKGGFIMRKVIAGLSVIGRLIVYIIGVIGFSSMAVDLLFPDSLVEEIVD